jgi:hypothetical protein
MKTPLNRKRKTICVAVPRQAPEIFQQLQEEKRRDRQGIGHLARAVHARLLRKKQIKRRKRIRGKDSSNNVICLNLVLVVWQ